jgi:predicted transcriptional regulator
MKTPCEIIVWQILPLIRRELARNLVNDHGLTQKETAEILGTTEASISRYISGKRGQGEIDKNEIINKIKESTNKIIKEKNKSVIRETCKICNLIQEYNHIDNNNYCRK